MDEAPLWIAINGERRIVLTCSPAQPVALALGHLIAEGWAGSALELSAPKVAAGPGGAQGVSVAVAPAMLAEADALRRHQRSHGCGLRHFLDCSPMPAFPAAAAPPVDLAEVFRNLFAVADAAAPGGGVHAVALCEVSGRLRYSSTDVARHCAVDRVLGLALLAGDGDRHGLVLTSRVSGAIAMKAVRGRVAWVASRSRGTSLAREILEAAGIPLLEHAVRRERRP